MLELGLSRLFGGDIELNPLPELGAVGRVLDHDRRITQPDDPALPGHDTIFRAEWLVRRHRLGHRVPDALLVIRVNEREPVLGMRDIVFRRPSQERFDLRADIVDRRRHPCKDA